MADSQRPDKILQHRTVSYSKRTESFFFYLVGLIKASFYDSMLVNIFSYLINSVSLRKKGNGL